MKNGKLMGTLALSLLLAGVAEAARNPRMGGR
jgi:hypothetical protein